MHDYVAAFHGLHHLFRIVQPGRRIFRRNIRNRFEVGGGPYQYFYFITQPVYFRDGKKVGAEETVRLVISTLVISNN